MTPNEIKKRLQYFSETKCKFCHMNECEDKETICNICIIKCIDYVLNLINQYEADIERLEIELKAMRGAANSYKLENDRLREEISLDKVEIESILDAYNNAKVEAIKDFAERLKREVYTEKGFSVFSDDTIDNLVEEMVGEGDA